MRACVPPPRAWFSCVLVVTSSAAVGCATSTNDGPMGDAGSGSSVTFASTDGGDASTGLPVVVVSADSGSPVVIVGGDDAGGGDETPDATSTSTPDTGTTGTPDTSTGTPDSSGIVDAPVTTQPDANTSTGDAGSCGFSTGVAACDACLTNSCCTSETACANNTACTTCVTSATPANSCSSNSEYTAFGTCFTNDCSTQCGGSADGGTDSGGGTTGGGTPTTCAEADTTIGCCGANGDNYYCGTGSSTVTKTACTGTKVCGWSASKGYYTCVAGPAEADPSGTYPLACK